MGSYKYAKLHEMKTISSVVAGLILNELGHAQHGADVFDETGEFLNEAYKYISFVQQIVEKKLDEMSRDDTILAGIRIETVTNGIVSRDGRWSGYDESPKGISFSVWGDCIDELAAMGAVITEEFDGWYQVFIPTVQENEVK